MELPKTFTSANVAAYIAAHYPDATDCIILDQQIQRLKTDIDMLEKIQDKPTFGRPGSQTYRVALLLWCRSAVQKKLNIFAISDCRNKIETVRQTESAQILADGSAAAESRILGDSKTKQYILIGVGAVVVLTILALVAQKK